MSATMPRPSRTEQLLMWTVLTLVKRYVLTRLWASDARRRIGGAK